MVSHAKAGALRLSGGSGLEVSPTWETQGNSSPPNLPADPSGPSKGHRKNEQNLYMAWRFERAPDRQGDTQNKEKHGWRVAMFVLRAPVRISPAPRRSRQGELSPTTKNGAAATPWAAAGPQRRPLWTGAVWLLPRAL